MKKKRNDTVELFIDKSGEDQRWHVVAPNGKILHACGEGFTSTRALLQNLKRSLGAPQLDVVIDLERACVEVYVENELEQFVTSRVLNLRDYRGATR